jgi:hypothetical protein
MSELSQLHDLAEHCKELGITVSMSSDSIIAISAEADVLRKQLEEEQESIDKQRKVIIDLSYKLKKSLDTLKEIKHEVGVSTDELGLWIYKTITDFFAEIDKIGGNKPKPPAPPIPGIPQSENFYTNLPHKR